MAVTEESKVRARHHTGYLNAQESATFQMGVPAAVQTQFMIEGSFAKILPSAEPLYYKLLSRLDGLEQLIEDNADATVATRIGNLEINAKELEHLLDRYMYWRGALCNLLGIPPNPFDMRFGGRLSGGGGVNVPVSHG